MSDIGRVGSLPAVDVGAGDGSGNEPIRRSTPAWRIDVDGRPLLGQPGTNQPEAIAAARDWWLAWTWAEVERECHGAPVSAVLSAYRRDGMEHICCDLFGADGSCHPVTMLLAGRLELCPGDPDVTDAVSAVYLVSRLLARWSLRAEVFA